MHTILDRMSLGLATRQLTDLTGNYAKKDNWYKAFQRIEAYVTEGSLVPFQIQKLDQHDDADMDWGDIHCQIMDAAENIHNTLKEALKLAKSGLVDATIEGELDSDANTYDMVGLVERGAALDNA